MRRRLTRSDSWQFRTEEVRRQRPEESDQRPDSAGYRAGKDLGADVALVGPGKAYERWKKTRKVAVTLRVTCPR
jgi:hypothetical protein